MTRDEQIEQRLAKSGHDLQSDEGARAFQQTLDRELERERKRVSEPRNVERFRGMLI